MVVKECLDVKLGVEASWTYLRGRYFTGETDHQALGWLDYLKEGNPHLARWSLSLQPYQFTILHKAPARSR